MFSGNDKVSCRQIYRNYTAAFLSLGALFAPPVMNRENISSILLALLFLGAFLMHAVAAPPPGAAVVKGLCRVHYWIIGTMLARMTGLVIQEFLLTDTALWVILGWFYLFCYYNLYKGTECRLRISEILFSFFLFLMLALPLLASGEAKIGRMRELWLAWGQRQWKLGYQLFCWMTALQSLWHLRGQTAQGKRFSGVVWRIWLSGAVFTVGLSLFSYCLYGDRGHAGLSFPLASATTLAHFPGGVIGRLDALFVFAWVIGLFLLCGSLFAPLMDGEPGQRQKYLLFALLGASFACASSPLCIEWGQKLLYWISTPIQLLLLLFYGLGKRKKGAVASLAFLLLLPLAGCGAQELEQQSLVTAIGVNAGEEKAFHLAFGFGSAAKEEGTEAEESFFEAEADSLSEAMEIYYEFYQKEMNLNHLKNFYFSRELLGQERFLTLLEEIQGNSSYSRGTSVYVTGRAASECAASQEQPEEGMPVHRILNAWHNREPCQIPVIAKDGRYKGFVIWPYLE